MTRKATQAAKRTRKTARSARTGDKKAKTGRPSKFTPALINAICERLAAGEPLAQICRDEGMPGLTTIWEWSKKDTAVSERIARAREAGFDQIAMDALGIADDGRRDYVDAGDGRVVIDHDHIQRSKLRVETRLKLLAKWDPKRYGEKLQQELSGPDGGPIPVAAIDASKLSDATLQELLNARRAEADGG